MNTEKIFPIGTEITVRKIAVVTIGKESENKEQVWRVISCNEHGIIMFEGKKASYRRWGSNRISRLDSQQQYIITHTENPNTKLDASGLSAFTDPYDVQKIEEFDTKKEAIDGIAVRFYTTSQGITLADGVHNEWWIYEGSVLRPDYKLVKRGNLFVLLMKNGDFRYS